MNGTGSRASSWLNWAQQPREAGGLGLAPHQAAGIVGNLVHESGQDLNPWGPTGDNGTAWGTAQWRGDRLARLKARPDYQTVEGQQAFMREELEGSENKAYRAIQAAKTPEEAAHAWDALYERSDGSTRAQRMASARQLMAQFGGDTGAASGDPGALTSAFAPTENRKSSMPAPALSADDTLGMGALNAADKPDNVYDGMMQMAASLASISNPDQAKALLAQAQLGKKAQGSWSHQVMKNGQILMSNTNGQTKIMGKPGDYSGDDVWKPVTRQDPNTGMMVQDAFNANTGQYASQVNQGGAGAATAAQPISSIDDLRALDTKRADAAQAVFEGRIPFPTGGRMNQQQQLLRNDVISAYPGVDTTLYSGRKKFMDNLATTQPSQPGGQYVGLGHTLDMAKQLSERALGLGNVDMGIAGLSHALNTTKDGMLGGMAMSTDRAAKTNALEENVDRMASEVGRLFSGNQGGGVHERENTRGRFNPNMAPAEFAENLKAVRDMVLSRKDELLSQADRLGISRDRIPGLDKLDGTLEQLNGNIDKLSGKRKDTAPASTGGVSWSDAQKAGWK